MSSIFSTILTSPTYDEIYYISVRATNKAGLLSEFTSNGQKYIDNLGIKDLSSELNGLDIYPNPTNESISFKNAPNKFKVIISDSKGKVCMSESLITNQSINIKTLSPGNYSVLIYKEGSFIIKPLIINQ